MPENLGVPLEGDRDFGELCGSHQGCQVPFRPPIQEGKGMTRMRQLDVISESMDVSLSKLRELLDRVA